jgi:hypothetical protein
VHNFRSSPGPLVAAASPNLTKLDEAEPASPNLSPILRSAVDGGESGGKSKGGRSGSSRMAGASRRETRFSQSWLGVGFFKNSRGNCGVFREALRVSFGPAREPLTKSLD